MDIWYILKVELTGVVYGLQLEYKWKRWVATHHKQYEWLRRLEQKVSGINFAQGNFEKSVRYMGEGLEDKYIVACVSEVSVEIMVRDTNLGFIDIH